MVADLKWIQKQVLGGVNSELIFAGENQYPISNILKVESMGAFRPSGNCDIIPCKARYFVVQERRFRLGNLF